MVRVTARTGILHSLVAEERGGRIYMNSDGKVYAASYTVKKG
jgi:hypothetical protein